MIVDEESTLSGCGTQSDVKRKRAEASGLPESEKHEAHRLYPRVVHMIDFRVDAILNTVFSVAWMVLWLFSLGVCHTEPCVKSAFFATFAFFMMISMAEFAVMFWRLSLNERRRIGSRHRKQGRH